MSDSKQVERAREFRGVKFIGEGERWLAESEEGLLALAGNGNFSSDYRLERLALSRMNRYGHCPFARGEAVRESR